MLPRIQSRIAPCRDAIVVSPMPVQRTWIVYAFRLLVLAVGVMVLSGGSLAYVTARNRSAAIKYIERAGGYVTFTSGSRRGGTSLPDWMRSVEEVQLFGADGCDLKFIVALHEVEILGCAGSKLNDERFRAVSELHRLHTVVIDKNEVTDAGLKALRTCRELKSLSLVGAPVTDAGLAELEGLPLTSLDLRRTQITDAGLAHLTGFRLESLMLGDTQVSDAGLQYLAGMPLTALSLERTSVTDEGLAEVAKLNSLAALYVGETQITDAGLQHVKGLPLTFLSLKDTHITDAGLDELENRPLEMLVLTETDVGRQSLSTLRAMKSLRVLYLSSPPFSEDDAADLSESGMRVMLFARHAE
jgi:hypothetical protein